MQTCIDVALIGLPIPNECSNLTLALTLALAQVLTLALAQALTLALAGVRVRDSACSAAGGPIRAQGASTIYSAPSLPPELCPNCNAAPPYVVPCIRLLLVPISPMHAGPMAHSSAAPCNAPCNAPQARQPSTAWHAVMQPGGVPSGGVGVGSESCSWLGSEL